MLDFHGRVSLTVAEAAERLFCSNQHVLNLIDSGALAAVDIAARNSRMAARIPVESFRDFVIRGMTCEWEHSPLRHLPIQSLVHLHREISRHLRAKGIRV